MALAVVLLPLETGSETSNAAVTYGDLALAVAVALTGRLLLCGERLSLLRSVPAVGFLTLGFASLVVTMLATNFPQNLLGGVRFVELFMLAPLAVMTSQRRRADVVIVAGSIVGLAVVEGGIGLVQTLTGTGASIGEQHIRAVGTFGAYNIMELATVTGIALVICLAVAVTRKGRLRWMALAGTLFLSLAHLASLSRGAWVATSVAAIVVLSRGRPLRLLATVATVLILAGVVLPPLAQSNSEVGRRVGSLLSAESTPDQSLTDRLALWSAAERMALDHPLTGVGPRAFADHRDAYADLSLLGSSDISFQSDVDFQQVALKSPHNLYLLLASEQGLVVLLVYCIVVVVLLVRGLMRAARRRSDASTSLALIGVGLLVYELVSTVTGDLGGPGSILWGVVIGLAGWAAADVDLAPRLAPDLEVLALPGAAVRPSAAPASRSVSSPPPTPEPAVAADAGELTREGAS